MDNKDYYYYIIIIDFFWMHAAIVTPVIKIKLFQTYAYSLSSFPETFLHTNGNFFAFNSYCYSYFCVSSIILKQTFKDRFFIFFSFGGRWKVWNIYFIPAYAWSRHVICFILEDIEPVFLDRFQYVFFLFKSLRPREVDQGKP